MSAYAVLLRGVNVSGTTMKMADVREALAAAGLDGARTVLASGNVLLDSGLTAAELGSAVQEVLTERFGYQAWVLVRTIAEIGQVVTGYPFDTDESSDHPYVVFCRNAAVLAALRTDLGQVDQQSELIAVGADVLYWQTPRGHSLDTPVAKALARARYKADTTTRNLRTLRRLLP